MYQQPSQSQMNGNHKIKGVAGTKIQTKSADTGMSISKHFQTSLEHKQDRLWADPICVTGSNAGKIVLGLFIYSLAPRLHQPLRALVVLCRF